MAGIVVKYINIGLLLLFIMVTMGCQQTGKSADNEQAPKPQLITEASETPVTNRQWEGFQAPTAIAFDAEGNMYVANWSGGTVDKINRQGERTVFVSIPGSPAGLACDKDGYIYVSDYRDSIYRVSREGAASVYVQGLHTPTGIAFNQRGELLVANRSSDEIVAVMPDKTVRVVAKGLKTPVGVVEHQDHTIFVTNYGGGVSVIGLNGRSKVITDFVRPGCGITVNNKGEVLAVDNGGGTIRRIDPDGASSTVVTEGLKSPVALAVSPEGNIYVGTWGDGLVHRKRLW